MKKTKILQFPIANANGGKTQYVLQNWKFIDRSRFHFDFMTVSPELDFADELLTQGCKIHWLSCRAEENEQQFSEEVNAALDEGYEAIHLHTGYWQSFLAEEIAKRRGVPAIIIHSHNTGIGIADVLAHENAMNWHERQKKIFSTDMATNFLACSNAASNWLYGPQIQKDLITILPYAIDVERFAYNPAVRKKCRHELGLDGCFVMGHIGRFEYQKNHGFLLDVFTGIYDEISNATLMLIGIGAEFERIKAKANDLGISDRILFLGKRDDTAALYQAMDLFVLPSIYEGLGIVMVESQTAGLKCIISSSASLPENTITSNVFSLPLDTAIWRDAIVKNARTSYCRRDHSIEVAAAGYSIKEQIKVLERIYMNSK